MFQVMANGLGSYLNFDPARKPDLVMLDKLMAGSAPSLKRYFHKGTPAGETGMRMKMIGYGKFRYAIKSGKTTEWPVIGVALQKNYISVYVSVTKSGSPLVQAYEGKLGALRMGRNHFSFVRFDDLRFPVLASLFADAASVFRSDPGNPVRYMQGT
jgi:hypothetical protein